MKQISVSSESIFSDNIFGSFLLSFNISPNINNKDFLGEIYIKKLNINDKTAFFFKFPDPKYKLANKQKFIIRSRSNQNNIVLKISLYEGNNLRKKFSDIIVNETLTTTELEWDAEVLENKFGKDLELRLEADGLVDLEKLPNSIMFIRNIEVIEEIKTKTENISLSDVFSTKSWSISNITAPISRSGSTRNNPEAILNFNNPSNLIVGEQKFILNFRCNNQSGKFDIALYEKGSLVKNFGTITVQNTNSSNTREFIWNANDIKDKSGKDVQIFIKPDDTLPQGSFYTFESIRWLATVSDNSSSTTNPLTPPQPTPPTNPPTGDIIPFPGWPRLPNRQGELGSFHGIGGPVDFWGNKRAFQIYDEWLGRPGNIIKIFCNSNRGYFNRSWEDIAGGPGTNLETLSGQFVGHPDNSLKPDIWPINLPIILQISLVPDDDRFRNIVNNKWRNPSIYLEIKNGAFDNHYSLLFRRIAYRCLTTKRDPNTVVLRLGGEMNGSWHAWSVGPDKQSFIDSWKRIYDIMVKSVESVFGSRKRFLVEFGPSYQLLFGNRSSERLWNIYPGNDFVDIITIGIHDNIGMKTQNDWDINLKKRNNLEGWQDYFDWAVSNTNKWIGTSEIESNYIPREYYPKTENMDVFWTTGFEVLRRRYPNRFLYFTYLTNGGSFLWRQDGWGEPYRKLYGIRK